MLSAMHDLTLAGQYADRLLLLDHGRLVADGPAGAVLTRALISQHYRAEVRVVWDRQGQKLNCAALPAGWDTDVGRYGSVYLVSAVTMNPAPF